MARSAFFDNAKVILIFLVVFGHLIQPMTKSGGGAESLYLTIYTFHMPAFILISGFFAKGSGNLQYILNLAKKLLIPYLIFQVIYSLFYFFAGSSSWNVSLFYPHWSLWFLFSLFSWHLLLCLFKRMPPIISLIVAIFLGVTIGYFEQVGHLFSLSRTFVFFPFFLAGYWLTKEQLMFTKRTSMKIFAFIAVAFISSSIYYAPEFSSGWLLASKSYGDLGVPYFGGLARLSVYAASAVMVFSIFSFIPQRQLSFTSLGKRTLYVYLLHGFIIQLFRKFDLFSEGSLLQLTYGAIIAGLIVFLLSSNVVIKATKPFVEANVQRVRSLWRKEDNERTA
ncbi:MAG TPA: acyltransferase family protein [Bacillota bacterium]|nr:acyltransferase family protein [Bacillota bacterium]